MDDQERKTKRKTKRKENHEQSRVLWLQCKRRFHAVTPLANTSEQARKPPPAASCAPRPSPEATSQESPFVRDVETSHVPLQGTVLVPKVVLSWTRGSQSLRSAVKTFKGWSPRIGKEGPRGLQTQGTQLPAPSAYEPWKQACLLHLYKAPALLHGEWKEGAHARGAVPVAFWHHGLSRSLALTAMWPSHSSLKG